MYVQTNKKPWPWYIPSLACYFSNVKKNYKKNISAQRKVGGEHVPFATDILPFNILQN